VDDEMGTMIGTELIMMEWKRRSDWEQMEVGKARR
jgi:hypothetical protein